MRYVRGGTSPDSLRKLEFNGSRVYKEREVQHLVDVRRVLRTFLLIQRVTLGLLLVAAVCYVFASGLRLTILRATHAGCVGVVVAIVAVVLLAAINFNWFFDRFHRIFFESGTWVFYETDTLIQLYPLRYWTDATWKLGVLALSGATLLGAVTKWAIWSMTKTRP